MASPGKKSFLLRVDPALWDVVEQLAAQELRSTNAQVEYLLREALAKRGRVPRRGPTAAPTATSAAPEGEDATD